MRSWRLTAPLILAFLLLFTSRSYWLPNGLKKSVSDNGLPNHSCKLPNGDMHACWIGEDILSMNGDFYKTLKSKANPDGVIILASVDSSFIDMAVNMYETSFRRFNIKNFLYVCSDAQAVKLLAERGIGCFLYVQATKNNQATEYGSREFILKMRVKMKMVTAAIMLGFTTVLTDLDIVFFRDPTPDLHTEADISLMSDVVMDNCGFYIARPTPPSVELHKRTLKAVMTHIIADQDAISAAIKEMVSAGTLKKTNLDKNKFSCGLVYFEDGKRVFNKDNPCIDNNCITDVVHNNWIVGKPAKIYRFKETGLWMFDLNGYYSEPSRKYIKYSNPIDFGNASKSKERDALKTALTIAKLLNRTLILPRFHCYGCPYGACKISNYHCSFNTHFHVRTFDGFFGNQYRENVFLSHSFVPETIKKSVSPELYIATKNTTGKVNLEYSTKIFQAKNYTDAKVAAADIIKWFGHEPFSQFSVLKFHSLYFEILYENQPWTERLNNALRWSDYRQYKVS